MAFSQVTTDPAAQAARFSLLVAFGCVTLWIVGQLHVSTFLVLFATTVFTSRRIHRKSSPGNVSVFQRTYLRGLKFLYRERPESGDLALAKGEKPREDSSASEDASRATRATANYAGQLFTQFHVSMSKRLATVTPDLWGRLLGCTALGVFAVVRRWSSGTPVSSGETNLVLRREGWTESVHWVSDLAVTEFAEQLTQLSPIVATTLTLAPLVFIYGVASGALLKRLAPNVPSFIGSLTALCPILLEDVSQTPGVGTSLLLVPMLAWCCWVAHDGSRRAGFVWALALTGCFIGMSGGALVLGALLLAEIVVLAEKRSAISVHWGRVFVGVVALSAMLVWIGGIPAHENATVRLPDAVSSFFLACCGWILFTATGVRDLPRRAAVRGLALTTACCLLAEMVPWVPELIRPSATTCLGLAALCLCLVLGQLLRSRRFTLVFYPAPLTVLLLAGWMTMGGAEADNSPTVSPSELKLIAQIEEEVLPWGYTLVAPPSFVAVMAGRSWYIDESQVERAFPASEYRFHPDFPERMIGTEWAFIVTASSGGKPGASWVRALIGAQVQVQPRPDLTTADWAVFALRRDKQKEARIANSLLERE